MTIDDEASEADKKQTRLADLLSGTIDYPSRGNRSFGSGNADIQEPLHVGKTPEFDDKTDSPTFGQYTQTTAPTGRGTKISHTIKNILNADVEKYLAERKAEATTKGTDRNSYSGTDAQLEAFLTTIAFKRLSAVAGEKIGSWGESFGKGESKSSVYTSGQGQNSSNWSMFYMFRENQNLHHNHPVYASRKQAGRKGVKRIDMPTTYTLDSDKSLTWLVGHMELKKELYSTLHALLRGDKDGVLKKQTPLLPIEMDLEIDGTGGIYPGNSFHSSYLTERYRELTVFQCLGASHKIDSSGWSTTLTGKMRYLPNTADGESLAQQYLDETPPNNRTGTVNLTGESNVVVTPTVEPTTEPITPLYEVQAITQVETVELESTYKYKSWQNLVLYGHQKVTNEDGSDQWVPTGMHKPEWQPLYLFSDGATRPYKKANIVQSDGTTKKEDFVSLYRAARGKAERKAYWDENIEAPNEGGATVGFDMLHDDTLSTIY